MRLLVVEDDHALATALCKGLGAHGFATDTVATVRHAAHLLRVNPYDAVILDLTLPDGDGLGILRDLRAHDHPVAVLVLTARGTVEDRVEGLDAGADDYLRKPFAFPELLARVRALLRRGAAVTQARLHVGDLQLDTARFEVRRGEIPIVLTVKEFAILEYFMRHRGELVTRTMLLDHCWGESYDGLSNLVDVHVSRLRRKLDVVPGHPLLHTVRGAGFILDEAR